MRKEVRVHWNGLRRDTDGSRLRFRLRGSVSTSKESRFRKG